MLFELQNIVEKFTLKDQNGVSWEEEYMQQCCNNQSDLILENL